MNEEKVPVSAVEKFNAKHMDEWLKHETDATKGPWQYATCPVDIIPAEEVTLEQAIQFDGRINLPEGPHRIVHIDEGYLGVPIAYFDNGGRVILESKPEYQDD